MFFRSFAYAACLSGSLLFGVGCDGSKPGSPKPESPAPKPGGTDHSKGDHKDGEGAHGHGKADDGHGKADHGHGKADHGHGKADHGHGKADHDHDEADHDHGPVRDNMLIADAGPYHILLSAHLAAEGNELHIQFETPDVENPKPMPIPVASFEAEATAGEGESQTLTFEPAPAEERPEGEKEGTYSKFVAKAPWMKPDDDLLVRAEFTVDGKKLEARWKEFVPKKYSHHAH